MLAEDASLTRFANSQIHQNVAETNVTVNLRFVVGKRVGVASSGRTDEEGLRRLAANARRHRPGRRGARGLGRAAGADQGRRGRGRVRHRDGERIAGAPCRRRPCRDRGGRRGRGQRLRVVLDRDGHDGRREQHGDPGRWHADGRAAPHGVDGTGRRLGLRGARRRRRDHASTPGRSVARPPRRRGRPRTRSASTRATIRSSSRSTRSSTCSTCSATWVSRPSPSRRSGASSRSVGRSGATWSRSWTTDTIRPACRWRSTTRASRSSA